MVQLVRKCISPFSFKKRLQVPYLSGWLALLQSGGRHGGTDTSMLTLIANVRIGHTERELGGRDSRNSVFHLKQYWTYWVKLKHGPVWTRTGGLDTLIYVDGGGAGSSLLWVSLTLVMQILASVNFVSEKQSYYPTYSSGPQDPIRLGFSFLFYFNFSLSCLK